MADNTSIEWCDHTFNPWEGCQKVSPGCDNCYAETRNARYNGTAINWGPGAPRRRTSESNWQKPRKWQREAKAFYEQHGRRQRVFCASLADVFDNAVSDGWRMDLFKLIADTPDLDWLLLTKRIGNVRRYLQIDGLAFDVIQRNVWLGITVVNQEEANRDIPKLLNEPACVRFLSMEPLLGPVSLKSNLGGILWMGGQRGCAGSKERSGAMHHGIGTPDCPRKLHHHHDDRCRPGIDWVIVGGESGAGARPLHPDWVISLRDQCAAAGTPFLFKQWGEHVPVHVDTLQQIGIAFRRVGKKAAGRRLHGIEHNGFPEARDV